MVGTAGRCYYVESHWFTKCFFGVLFFNGAVLVLQTSVGLEGQTLGLETKIWQQWLACADDTCLMIFALEWLLRFLANGMRFLTTSDCWFDFVVLAVSVPGFRVFGTSPVCAVPCKFRRFSASVCGDPVQMWLVSVSVCADPDLEGRAQLLCAAPDAPATLDPAALAFRRNEGLLHSEGRAVRPSVR